MYVLVIFCPATCKPSSAFDICKSASVCSTVGVFLHPALQELENAASQRHNANVACVSRAFQTDQAAFWKGLKETSMRSEANALV